MKIVTSTNHTRKNINVLHKKYAAFFDTHYLFISTVASKSLISHLGFSVDTFPLLYSFLSILFYLEQSLIFPCSEHNHFRHFSQITSAGSSGFLQQHSCSLEFLIYRSRECFPDTFSS